MDTVRICTFNVNSIRARKDLIISWLDHREYDLDVLCFQETKVVDEDFPLEDFERLGYSCEIYGQKSYNGVAICSKMQQVNVRKGFNEINWDRHKRIICTQIGKINLINVYAPHGDLRGTEKHDYKLGWYNRFLSFLQDNYDSTDRLMVLGDFNIAREDLDVFDSEMTKDRIGTMVEEREVFQSIIDWGLIDLFRYLYPTRKQFTWWDYIGGAIWKNAGMRIDYILCSKPLLKEMKMLEIDLWTRRRRTPKPSDHAPIIVEMTI